MAALLGKTKQKYVVCEDIDVLVATSLLNPEMWKGRVFTIAGQVADVDELQVALDRGSLTRTWGRIWIPRWASMKAMPCHDAQMFDWLYYNNCQPGDPAETYDLLPEVRDIETWARKQRERAESAT